jgi:hypothetical protein
LTNVDIRDEYIDEVRISEANKKWKTILRDSIKFEVGNSKINGIEKLQAQFMVLTKSSDSRPGASCLGTDSGHGKKCTNYAVNYISCYWYQGT